MAEFALGLTKTAVEGTLIRVKSAIEEEAELKERVQNDLVFITGEFDMMRSFLYAANASERAKNPVVRTWVRQLRDLAFDVEDCIDFVVNLDNNKPCAWLWRVVPSCIAPPRPLDQAIAEIKQLKTRVEDVSKRNARYNLIGNDPMPPNHLIPVATASSSTFDILSEVWKAAGKLRGTGDLKKLITSEGDDRQVISLWQGSCSTGAAVAHPPPPPHHHHHLEATYIIKKAYDDPEIGQGFKSRAWIKLMHPFDPDEFLKNLLAQFYPPGSSNHKSKELGGPEFQKKMRAAVAAQDDFIKAELMHQVSDEQRYLVVLEGVSNVLEWDAIRMYLPDSNNGSRVVVSTEHLRIALLCTREPYQVSQLRRFSDGQFLCAFSSKGSVRRSDIGEFNWQIRCGGVISVVGNYSRNEGIIPKVYQCIMRKRKGFDGVLVFEKHSWVDVQRQFDMNDFAVSLFLNFQSRDFDPKRIAEVGKKGDQCVIEQCCKYLHEDDCLVVINGLRATEDWDKIKNTFLSKPAKCKNSIIVITENETVAKHCVLDQQNRVFDIKALEDDEILDRLTKQDTEISRGVEDSIFYDRTKEAFYWSSFELDGREKELSTLEKQLQNINPGVISVWGRSGVGKSTLVRKIFYGQVMTTSLVDRLTSKAVFSWVDVPHPFDLTDFSWRLLLDFQSNCGKKEFVAAFLMKGQFDPFEMCRNLLHGSKHLVVIDGLESKQDWDIIRKAFFSEPNSQSGSIIVVTNKNSVAKHCVDDNEDRLLKIRQHRDGESLRLPSVKDPSFFVGRGKEMGELIRHLQNPAVISLWGISGVGKSALVRNILDNHMDMVCYGGQKQHKMSWVDVPHPFHLMEFSRRLLLGFYSKDLQAQETAAVGIMEGQDTVQACCNFLRQDKCLVVIDGLGSTHDWDLIKSAFLSEPTPSSSIIVITTEQIVAIHCASDKRTVHNLKGLEAEDGLHLFTKVVGGPQQLASKMDLVKDIMAKCGGLPRVIAAIGEYLAQEISKINQEGFGETTLTTILVFTSDKSIRRRRLLRRWIAEGYSRDTSGGGTAEENGEELFAELVASSIIQLQQTPSSNNKVDDDVCQVNGFFREYIISRPMEDNLVFALEGRCSVNSQRAGQHLTIRSCWDRDKIVFESIDFTRLRSLTVFGEWRSFFISNDSNMGLLRVLDLEDTKSGLTDNVLEQIGELLPRLKFLSVRGCKDITRLPDSLGGLRQLETLDIRHTKIAILPHAIIKLVKLQYVRAGTTHKTLDEGVNACLPSSDEDDCTLTSSKDSLSSMEDDDCTVADIATSQVDGGSLMRSQPPLPASPSGVETSRSQLATSDGDCTSKKLLGTADGDDTSITEPVAADADGTSTSAQTCGHNTSQAPAVADNCDDTGRRQQPSADDRASTTRSPWMSKAHNAVVSYSRGWLSKKKLCARCVEAPATAIGKLTALHTFGVVNVSGAHGKAVLEELKKLTQLRKLGVCGINRENWHDLCCNISDHGHLKSLSLHLDKDDDGASFFSSTDGMFSNLPKTLKSFKIYTKDGQGNVQMPSVLIEHLGNLSNVKKGNLKLTVSTQEDIDILAKLPNQGMFRHVCVKPTQDGKLGYGRWGSGWRGGDSGALVLEIDCGSYNLAVYFGPWIPRSVQVLVIHCSSTNPSLELLGFPMLRYLPRLKQVTLKGSYNQVLKQHLQRKIGELPQRIVLKLEDEQQGPQCVC
ncbi:unnamed protein product [Alopecurus aequalis]